MPSTTARTGLAGVVQRVLAPEGSGSIGRAPVSKTGGWGFESLLPCEDETRREKGRTVTETRSTSSSSERRPTSDGRTSLGLFLRQVMAELRKVIWPTREQLVTYFMVVLVFVLFMIALVSLLDYAFNSAMFKIFG